LEAAPADRAPLRLLGAALFAQAATSLVGGAVFFDPYVKPADIAASMGRVADNIGGVYAGVLLQLATAVVIIILGVLLYQAAGHINRTAALIALSFYIFEALLLSVSQIFVFALADVSRLYALGPGGALESAGGTLLICHDFAARMAIIPFGLGAIIFYYLLLKAGIIPRWLALWGLITVPFVLIGVPLTAFGARVPFALFVPYVPFEFFAGIFIFIKGMAKGKAFEV